MTLWWLFLFVPALTLTSIAACFIAARIIVWRLTR
jgi:hypothetical protein